MKHIYTRKQWGLANKITGKLLMFWETSGFPIPELQDFPILFMSRKLAREEAKLLRIDKTKVVKLKISMEYHL